MSRVRLYVDIHVGREIVEELNRRGVDTIAGYDIGGNADPDAMHLERAASLGRVMVTGDSDFARLHSRMQHAGIAKLRTRRRAGEIVELLCLPAESHEAEDLENTIQFL